MAITPIPRDAAELQKKIVVNFDWRRTQVPASCQQLSPHAVGASGLAPPRQFPALGGAEFVRGCILSEEPSRLHCFIPPKARLCPVQFSSYTVATSPRLVPRHFFANLLNRDSFPRRCTLIHTMGRHGKKVCDLLSAIAVPSTVIASGGPLNQLLTVVRRAGAVSERRGTTATTRPARGGTPPSSSRMRSWRSITTPSWTFRMRRESSSGMR